MNEQPKSNPIETLEKLAEKHNIDATFRNKFVKTKLIGWPFGILTGAAMLGGSFYWMAADELGFMNGFATAIGAVTTGGSIYQLVKAIKTRGEYRQEDENLCPKAFYYLDVSISSLETAVERNYGSPIITRDSVKELESFKEKEYVFIDHVTLKDQSTYEYAVIETDPDCGSSSISCYRGSFSLTRDGINKLFSYDVRGSVPSDMKRLMKNENKELALLLSKSADIAHNTKPFDVVAIYDQHTLKYVR